MKVELWSLFSAHRLMILCICTKFHENISKGFRVIARTQNHDGRTDRRMDRQGDYYRALPTSSGAYGAPPTSSGGALKIFQTEQNTIILQILQHSSIDLQVIG